MRRARYIVPVSLLALALLAWTYVPQVSLALQASGDPPPALVGSADLSSLTFSVAVSATADTTVNLDGRDVSDAAKRTGDHIAYQPGPLADGPHSIVFEAARAWPLGPLSKEFRFEVDTTPPSISVPDPSERVRPGRAVTFVGKAPTATSVKVDGKQVTVTGGSFEFRRRHGSRSPVRIVAIDAAGNRSVEEVRIKMAPPARDRTPIRAVHASALAWATKSLRRPIMTMIDRDQINAVEIDLKDESGLIGYRSKIPLARRIGAVQGAYRLRSEVKRLHGKGAIVVGRLVAFRDPVLARASWNRGHRSRVIQTPARKPLSKYGGFTNFADPEVVDYNIDIAVEAARAGVDHVLYDYVRRPEGRLSALRIPNLKTTPEKAIVDFLAEARKRLRPYGTTLGASVFGVAALHPKQMAQDIPRIARKVNYVAPMVYPSLWATTHYGVADPVHDPYAIVRRSLKHFKRLVKGTKTKVIPWLQDFTLSVHYGRAEVKAQIKAARDSGIDQWLLWDPRVTYTSSALKRRPR